jgi:tol-pal system protein YbgF
MRRISTLVLVVVAAIGASASPLSAANREHEQLAADLRMLQEQTQQLQLLLGTLSEAIKAVNGRLDEQAAADRKAFADHKLLVDNLTGEVRVVREKLDETNVRLTSLSQDVEGLRELMPALGSMMVPAGPTDPNAPPGETGTTSAAGATTGVPAAGASPKRLYDQAYADYAGGQWSLAIQGFEMYLKTYPKSELSDDALYYVGESYSNDSKWRDAAAAYERVIREYPTGDILPEAWYKLGLSYDRLGQPDRARDAFEEVVRKYESSQAAKLAEQALERLKRRAR